MLISLKQNFIYYLTFFFLHFILLPNSFTSVVYCAVFSDVEFALPYCLVTLPKFYQFPLCILSYFLEYFQQSLCGPIFLDSSWLWFNHFSASILYCLKIVCPLSFFVSHQLKVILLSTNHFPITKVKWIVSGLCLSAALSWICLSILFVSGFLFFCFLLCLLYEICLCYNIYEYCAYSSCFIILHSINISYFIHRTYCW